jgi:hypothetical protein
MPVMSGNWLQLAGYPEIVQVQSASVMCTLVSIPGLWVIFSSVGQVPSQFGGSGSS